MVKKNAQKKKHSSEAREVHTQKAEATGAFAEASSGKDGRTVEKAVGRGAFEQEALKKGRKHPRDGRTENEDMPRDSPPARKTGRKAKRPSKTLSVAEPVATSEPRTTSGTLSCTSKAAEYETVHDAEEPSLVRKKKKRMKRSGRSYSKSLSAAVSSQSSDDVAASSIPEVREADDGGGEGTEAHAALEGILHDGTIYLVDDRKRVFSSTRDARGGLVQVGILDAADGGIAFSPGFDAERVSTAVESGSMEAPGDTDGSGDGALEEDGADEGTAVASGATSSDMPKARKKKARKKGRKKRATGDAGAAVSGADEADAGVEALGGEQRDAGQEGGGLKVAVQTVAYPFEVDECDHCETSERAYADIAPLLGALAKELGKSPAELAIYDPYYCQGSTIGRLASVGFPNVYNRNEDFYEAWDKGSLPEHDAVVTNPPFSGDHLPKVLRFCSRRGSKPWFLLLPNYVYLKDYYGPSLAGRGGRGPLRPFYLTPSKRYSFYSPQGSRVNVRSGERKTSPFNTFWYVHVGDEAVTSKVIQHFNAVSNTRSPDDRCCLARTTAQIPHKMMDSNDPRRKKARDRQRSIERIRQKKSMWVQAAAKA